MRRAAITCSALGSGGALDADALGSGDLLVGVDMAMWMRGSAEQVSSR